MCEWDLDAEVTWETEIILHVSAPSQNQTRGNHKYAYGYRNIKKDLMRALAAELVEVPRAKRWRRGIIHRCYAKGKRAYDVENLVGGCKPLIDMLKESRVIIDDNKKWWQGAYLQSKSETGKDYIRITLQECAGK